MKLLGKIVHEKGMMISGSTIHREAVRGIIHKEDCLLMIYSAQKGDYKFPGGGIVNGETHQQALRREIREECGAVVNWIGPGFGKMIEYRLPKEVDYQVFKMTSFYYFCQVNTVFFDQQLDQYEVDLGFQPVWVNIDKAIDNNKNLSFADKNKSLHQDAENIRWLKRETFVLERLKMDMTATKLLPVQ